MSAWRHFILVACVVSVICLSCLIDSRIQAQSYPYRPIQVVIPTGPGVATDIHGRILIEELKKILKTSIMVVNKPGASMTVGTDFVVKSKKDGYTLLYTPAPGITYSKALEPEIVSYDPIKDLEPLGLHAFFPVVIAVAEGSPWKTFHEFLDEAKKTPKKIRISSPGIQTTASFNLAIIETLTDAKFTQVPYKEGSAAVTSMLGGHVEATTHALSVLIPFANQGKARILLTSKKTKDFPNVPTLDELGYKQELFSPWFAMFAPAGVPEEVKKVLVPAIKEAINHPDVTAKINNIGGSVIEYRSPGELKKLAMEELETISVLAIKLGLRK